MEEPDVDQDSIEKLLTSPRADFQIDKKSGNYVFRFRDYRIVVRETDDIFVVTSIFKADQKPS